MCILQVLLSFDFDDDYNLHPVCTSSSRPYLFPLWKYFEIVTICVRQYQASKYGAFFMTVEVIDKMNEEIDRLSEETGRLEEESHRIRKIEKFWPNASHCRLSDAYEAIDGLQRISMFEIFNIPNELHYLANEPGLSGIDNEQKTECIDTKSVPDLTQFSSGKELEKEYLTQLCKIKGFTQKQIAEREGKSQSRISEILKEHGISSKPNSK